MIYSEQQLLNEMYDINILNEKELDLIKKGHSENNTKMTYLENSIVNGIIKLDKVLPYIKTRIKYISLNEMCPEDNAINLVSFKYADFYGILPLKFENQILLCAMTNPFDSALRREIEKILELSIDPVWAFSSDIKELHKRYYGLDAQLSTKLYNYNNSKSINTINDFDDEFAVRLVDKILLDAVAKRSTDIHIEPHEIKLRLRYRIDGILYDQYLTEDFSRHHATIVARLKVMANLNLADKRKPQDGRIKTSIDGHDLDLRISILPTIYGETVDIRILDKNQINIGLSELGFSDDDLIQIESLLSRKNGIILVTGPTGSGKTTTLYSFLKKLNTTDQKIITIEDPIEYQLSGITQLQVHPQINFTFANGLRSMLRHDPDIMMVGEIRDHETAKIAIQVSLTGHLVLSTVHTNDSVSTLTRFLDMGVERYLFNATVECVIAQRLIRKLCPFCKKEVSREETKLDFVSFAGEGCSYCNNTGFYDRTGIFEIFEFNNEYKEMLTSHMSVSDIKRRAIHNGLRTLYNQGMEKVKLGITSYSEILRILHTDE